MNVKAETDQPGSLHPAGYAALQRAERYPELKHIDTDLLDEWRDQWGADPYNWNVTAVLNTQLARNMRELCEALRYNEKLTDAGRKTNK